MFPEGAGNLRGGAIEHAFLSRRDRWLQDPPCFRFTHPFLHWMEGLSVVQKREGREGLF
jgi:hypothetical protein